MEELLLQIPILGITFYPFIQEILPIISKHYAQLLGLSSLCLHIAHCAVWETDKKQLGILPLSSDEKCKCSQLLRERGEAGADCLRLCDQKATYELATYEEVGKGPS